MSNPTLQFGVDALFDLSDSELELELGRRLTETREELREGKADLSAAQPAGPTPDREQLMSLPSFVRDVAQRFLKDFDHQIYSLICDPNDEDGKQLRLAADQGARALGYALGGAFIATFGWLPGIATVIAVILARRIAKSTYTAFCGAYKERLGG
ncbi:MAG: hypothetical protein JO036_07295 [Candidatus Eremiobacteraeota bacterium]|nr:hypothetical protein [Candidatus Eremiobacteraeota bacterium]